MAISDGEKKKREMKEGKKQKPKSSERQMTEEEVKKQVKERDEKFNKESAKMETDFFKADIELAEKIKGDMKVKRASYELNVMTFVNKLIEFQLDVLKDTPWMGFVGDGDMAKNWKAMFEKWDQDTVAKSHISVRR